MACGFPTLPPGCSSASTFFVAEPQVDVHFRVTPWLRVGGGVGYRLIGAAEGFEERLTWRERDHCRAVRRRLLDPIPSLPSGRGGADGFFIHLRARTPGEPIGAASLTCRRRAGTIGARIPRDRHGHIARHIRVKIHEYQAKAILAQYGVPVPRGEMATTASEAGAIARRLGGGVSVVKAQIHAGGRGKGGGVKVVKSPEEAEKARQPDPRHAARHPPDRPGGAEGRRASSSRRACRSRASSTSASLIDRATRQPGAHGERRPAAWTSRKWRRRRRDLHHQGGHRSRRRPHRLPGAQDRLRHRPRGAQIGQAVKLLTALYQAFVGTDASLIEINPLIVTNDGNLLALDAKVTFDDNALFRHQDFRRCATSTKRIRSRSRPRSSR